MNFYVKNGTAVEAFGVRICTFLGVRAEAGLPLGDFTPSPPFAAASHLPGLRNQTRRCSVFKRVQLIETTWTPLWASSRPRPRPLWPLSWADLLEPSGRFPSAQLQNPWLCASGAAPAPHPSSRHPDLLLPGSLWFTSRLPGELNASHPLSFLETPWHVQNCQLLDPKGNVPPWSCSSYRNGFLILRTLDLSDQVSGLTSRLVINN